MRETQVPVQTREQAVTRLMENYGNIIVQMCCLYLGDAALAQDAAQETFLKAYRNYDSFRHECSEKNWLIRIALNVCRDMRKSKWFRFVDTSVELEKLPLAARDAEMPDSTVLDTVKGLDVKYRMPLLLRYFQHLSTEEIAQVLHLPRATVRTRLRRGKEQLKQLLEKGGVTL